MMCSVVLFTAALRGVDLHRYIGDLPGGLSKNLLTDSSLLSQLGTTSAEGEGGNQDVERVREGYFFYYCTPSLLSGWAARWR